MQEVFEKIIKMLKESSYTADMLGATCEYVNLGKAIEIVNKAVEEYNNGWIPVEDRVPDHNIDVEVTLANGVRHLGWYSKIREEWIDPLSDDENTLNVIAWKEPSASYQPKGGWETWVISRLN